MNSHIITKTQSYTNYNSLPDEIKLHILKFANLETLIDVVRYIDKKHQTYVIDILKKYTLTQSDYNNTWFEYIQNHRIFFLHKYINILWDDTPIISIKKTKQVFNWNIFIDNSILYSSFHNDIDFFILLTKTYYLNTTIQNYMAERNLTKSWDFTILHHFINNISSAIRYNSFDIVKTIFTDTHINFMSLIDNIKKYNDTNHIDDNYIDDNHIDDNQLNNINNTQYIFLELANHTIKYNRIHMLNYLNSFYTYTNQDYNYLLINCSTSHILNNDIKNDKPNIIDYISLNITNLFTQTLTSFIENVSIYDDTILHFITSYQSKLSLQHYQYVLDYYIRQPNFNYPNNTNTNQQHFLTVLRLYIKHYTILENHHSSFEPVNYFKNYKHITKNLDNIKECIKIYPKEDIYKMFTHSFLYKLFMETIHSQNTEVMVYVKEIFLNEFIKYGFTKEDFSNIIVHFIILHIKSTQLHKYNAIKYNYTSIKYDYCKDFFDKLISGLPMIYNQDNIEKIMIIISIYCYNSKLFQYFNTLCVNKSNITKLNYIILLKKSISLLFSENTYSNSSSYNYLLLILKTIDKPYDFNTDIYKNLLLKFIMNMYIEKDEPINLQKIKIMFENGMVLCKHNDKEKNIFNILKIHEKRYKMSEVITLFNEYSYTVDETDIIKNDDSDSQGDSQGDSDSDSDSETNYNNITD